MPLRPWLIVGTATRALAQAAARHGHAVCAIDAYADRDTLQACEGRVLRLDLGPDERFAPPAHALARGPCERRFAPAGLRGIVAGNGLDGDLAARAVLERTAPVCGCDAATVRRLRDPLAWSGLLDRIGAPHPDTRFDAPPAPAGWLVKSDRGTGGLHVRRWRARAAVAPGGYFQRHVAGRPASLLFCADGARTWPIGWQWQRLAPTPELAWRYGGVMTAPDLGPGLRKAAWHWLQRIAGEVPLRGVGSLDFLVEGDQLQLLELNPRPTASVALYPGIDIFGLHVAPAAHVAPPRPAHVAPACGETIFYAGAPLSVAAHHDWPPWCADLPASATDFAAGDAVCTVQASAATVRGLRLRLAHRLHHLARSLAGAQTQDESRDKQLPSQRKHPGASPGRVAAG